MLVYQDIKQILDSQRRSLASPDRAPGWLLPIHDAYVCLSYAYGRAQQSLLGHRQDEPRRSDQRWLTD